MPPLCAILVSPEEVSVLCTMGGDCMSKQLTEQQVLQALNIPDFRHLSKDKVISFASMLTDMEPEVAMKALEQFPEFAKTILELAKDCKSTIDKGLDGNTESMEACAAILQSIIDSLQSQLSKDDVPFEERKYYIDKMFEAAQMQAAKDTENKQFIIKVLEIAGGAALVLSSVALVALGGKAGFKLPFKKQ